VTDETKSYKTAGAFRIALETRLQTRAREKGTDLQRLRRHVAFDRFLARMFSKGPKATYPWMLKGGYAMELRTHSPRTTKDIDLTLHDGPRLSKDRKERTEQVRGMLQEAASTRFDDYFEFLIGEAREDLDGAPEGGSRYSVQARMDGRDFARFHVDVGIGDEVLEPLDVVTGEDWLGFGGVARPSFPVISAEQQFAEKLHAYTLPRERVNTRTRDLIDMVLLIRGGKIDQGKAAAAIRATFSKRATHDVPTELNPPPAEWKPVFDALAKECDLTMTLQEGFEIVREFTQTLER
jgi:predicted nucleotidyltransferase component of viral defense system